MDMDNACTTPSHGYFFTHSDNYLSSDSASFEFHFSSHSNQFVSMTSADELFFNGQIRPMQNPPHVGVSGAPHHRKTRSMSPFRGIDHWNQNVQESIETTPSSSASSSRSSSSGRNSNKWIFLKDLLHTSGRPNNNNTNKERFWSAFSFAPKMGSPVISPSSSRGDKKGKEKRVPISAHELHYTANRAQAEEIKKKKKTSLPYRQGLFGFYF